MSAADASALENLVNQVAHDVRNHAFTMGLQAEMGQRRSAAAPEIKAHFDAIVRQVDALSRYLDQLLLFGRPVNVAPTLVDPVALAQSQIDLLRGRHGDETALDVRVEADPRGRRANWDPHAFGHALRALLDNAVESATPPPAIVVAVRDAGDHAEVEVRDAGPGIAPDVLAQLGTPMAVRRPGGAGLGIAIARKMAGALGGRLEIESTPAGVTARLVLPWEASPA
ncbi:MAG: ATP-binding protein [Thermoanaerobaculaceae bacterium]|nr:ATP-binding protein [Thermoanaerobaculaceae bacterium]TAM44945.1 MAG: hypothetical protein EPN53_15565 [Acidobacteriota bacterium]